MICSTRLHQWIAWPFVLLLHLPLTINIQIEAVQCDGTPQPVDFMFMEILLLHVTFLRTHMFGDVAKLLCMQIIATSTFVLLNSVIYQKVIIALYLYQM